MSRHDGRRFDELRAVSIDVDAQRHPVGSSLVSFGATRVLCAVSADEGVPPFRAGRGGWLTAEYAMLPGATDTRAARERRGPGGRSKEIERLVGRSLRSVVDLDVLGELTLTADCDVLDADGGTRTAAITGAWVALVRALRQLGLEGAARGQVAAVSVGLVDGEPVLDLDYTEDSKADVDMNVVMTADGDFVEVQGTAEGDAFPRRRLDELLDLAQVGCGKLFARQQEALDA